MAYVPPVPRRWYEHPAFSITGFLLTVLAVVLAIYFYLGSEKVRQLDFIVSPDKALVVKSEFSDLHVLYKSREIKEDVTAAQIAIWNAGNEPIRPEDVLSAVEIVTEPPVEILTASVRRTSRPVIGFSLDDRSLAKGLVPLSWKILEQDDGAVVQLIYVGSPSIKLKLTGTVVGRRPIVPISARGATPASEHSAGLRNEVIAGMAAAVLAFGSLLFALMLRSKRFSHLAQIFFTRDTFGVLLLATVVYAGFAVFLLYQAMTPSIPPF